MMKLKRYLLTLSLSVLLCLSMLAVQPAAAAVTLLSFTATTVNNAPIVYLHWETATERETAGYDLERSVSANGPFESIGDFISAQGDAFNGASYDYDDATVQLNTTYYYKLIEVQNDQNMQQIGDTIKVDVEPASENGQAPTSTPMPTATPTATPVPTISDPVPDDSSASTTSRSPIGNVNYLTPYPTGATITPQSTRAGDTSAIVPSQSIGAPGTTTRSVGAPPATPPDKVTGETPPTPEAPGRSGIAAQSLPTATAAPAVGNAAPPSNRAAPADPLDPVQINTSGTTTNTTSQGILATLALGLGLLGLFLLIGGIFIILQNIKR